MALIRGVKCDCVVAPTWSIKDSLLRNIDLPRFKRGHSRQHEHFELIAELLVVVPNVGTLNRQCDLFIFILFINFGHIGLHAIRLLLG